MRVLLDEGVPHQLRSTLERENPDHIYFSAQRAGLTGDAHEFQGLNPQQKDERLLNLAKEDGYEALITVDKKMQNQQDPTSLPINVVTLDVGKENQQTYENLKTMIPELNNRLDAIEGSISRGEPPGFTTISAADLNRYQEQDRAVSPVSERDDNTSEPAQDRQAAPPDSTNSTEHLAHIDLPKYAAAEHGYDVEQRGANKYILEKDGEEIRAERGKDGTWSYENQDNDADQGQIQDFAARRGRNEASIADYLKRNPEEQKKADESMEAAQKTPEKTMAMERSAGGRDE